MVVVQWYYKKTDLDMKKLNISEDDAKFIGENEVFQTNHQDKVFADSIIAKCNVFTIKEYDELESIDFNTTFFTRASYCPVKKQLTPEFKDWEKYCECKKPLNPNDRYVNCDDCRKWFHPDCVQLTEEDVQKEEDWFCNQCLQSKPAAEIKQEKTISNQQKQKPPSPNQEKH